MPAVRVIFSIKEGCTCILEYLFWYCDDRCSLLVSWVCNFFSCSLYSFLSLSISVTFSLYKINSFGFSWDLRVEARKSCTLFLRSKLHELCTWIKITKHKTHKTRSLQAFCSSLQLLFYYYAWHITNTKNKGASVSILILVYIIYKRVG